MRTAKREKTHFTIQLSAPDHIISSVLSLLVLPQQLTLVVGLSDGRMVLYDLIDLQPFHMAHPPERDSPLIHLTFMEPTDDPRQCIYIWAYHDNRNQPIAVMHSIMFEKKTKICNEIFYLNFLSCSVRLTVPFTPQSTPITCKTVRKETILNEEIITLCLFLWHSHCAGADTQSSLLVFDLDQWYKQQMPDFIDIRKTRNNCIALFKLTDKSLFDFWLDPITLTSFNSVQRPEEHFYPNSLSFGEFKFKFLNFCRF